MRFWFAILLMLMLAGSTRAHDLGVECKIVGEMIDVEAYFDDNADAAGAKIRVVAGGKTIAEGTADQKGRWSFPRPAPGQILIEVDAGAGHRTRLRFDVPGAATKSQPPPNTRSEFTRFRWQPLAMGLAIIGSLAAAAWAFLKLRQPSGGRDSKS